MNLLSLINLWLDIICQVITKCAMLTFHTIIANWTGLSFIRQGTVDASIDPTSEASRPMDQTDHQLYQSVVAQQHTAIIALTTQVASIHHVSICSPISKCMTTDRRRASVLVLLLSTLKSSHKVFGESFCDSWSQRSQDQTSPACTRLLW